MIKNKRGVLLIENVVAIVLLGMVVTATIFSFASARMWVRAAKHHYQAIGIAREKIEDIIAEGDSTPGAESVVVDSDTGLTGTITVSNPTADTVDVTVSWTEKLWTDKSSAETIVLLL